LKTSLSLNIFLSVVALNHFYLFKSLTAYY